MPLQIPRGERRKQPKIAAGERPIRSKLEQAAIEWFRERRLDFQYEPLIVLGGRQYRPDFYLPQLELFVEICGFGHMPYYNDRVEEKRRHFEKAGLRVEFIAARSTGQLRAALAQIFPGDSA